MPQLPALPSTPRTTLVSVEALELGLEKFDREALWLLLSIHHYGWRAHADMASYLAADADPSQLGEHHFEHRAMAMLEELFLLLDQIWRLISAIRAHRAGASFIVAYRRWGSDIATEFRTLQRMSEEEWRVIYGLPTDEDLPALLAEHGVLESVAEAQALRDDVLQTTVRNIDEVNVFFVRTEPVEGQHGRSLREVSNAYRHGTQVVYEDTSPAEIPWRSANPDEAQGMLVGAAEVGRLARRETVNVLLEGADDLGHARFASVPRTAEANEGLVVSMRHLSLLLWRITTSFLVAELQGGPVLSSMAPFSWEELDARFRANENPQGVH